MCSVNRYKRRAAALCGNPVRRTSSISDEIRPYTEVTLRRILSLLEGEILCIGPPVEDGGTCTRHPSDPTTCRRLACETCLYLLLQMRGGLVGVS